MDAPHDRDEATQIELLRALLDEHASIDLGVLEIREDVWIIHGVFPYDGEVPMAEFSTREEAERVLDEICGMPSTEDL